MSTKGKEREKKSPSLRNRCRDRFGSRFFFVMAGWRGLVCPTLYRGHPVVEQRTNGEHSIYVIHGEQEGSRVTLIHPAAQLEMVFRRWVVRPGMTLTALREGALTTFGLCQYAVRLSCSIETLPLLRARSSATNNSTVPLTCRPL
jgi:hypothetical protein